MADAVFDASVIGWTKVGQAETDLAPLISFRYEDAPAEVDLSGAASTTHQYAIGRSKENISIEYVGTPDSKVAIGFKGALDVDLGDGGTTGTLGNCIITKLAIAGRIDDKITTSLTIRPCNA
jgi:hypothetical protein